MKTIKQVITNYPQRKKLINAVLKQLGDKRGLEDIYRNAISGGYSGFIYYIDKHNFAMENRKSIIELLEEQTFELLGEQAFDLSNDDVIEMVKSFNTFSRNGMDKDELKDLYRYLGGAKVEQGSITNIMAWYAFEEVARMFCDE